MDKKTKDFQPDKLQTLGASWNELVCGLFPLDNPITYSSWNMRCYPTKTIKLIFHQHQPPTDQTNLLVPQTSTNSLDWWITARFFKTWPPYLGFQFRSRMEETAYELRNECEVGWNHVKPSNCCRIIIGVYRNNVLRFVHIFHSCMNYPFNQSTNSPILSAPGFWSPPWDVGK